MAWLHSLVHGLTVREALTSAVDVLVVAYLIYRALLLVKGTRAAQMLTALVLVAGGFYLAKVFELSTLLWLLDNLINYSIIFVIVIFQQDIRRGLTSVGATLFASGRQYEETFVFEEVIRAAEQLARARTGALIVLQREADLDEFLSDPGEAIDARVSKELLVALFIPSPQNTLHDGAVIIRDRRVFRAGCVMPLSANRKLDKSLGTRHRAAIGITEETDAVVVVVSEERGAMSLCFGGNIAADLDAATLRKAILGLFQKEKRPTAARKSGKPAPARRGTSEITQKVPLPVGESPPPASAPIVVHAAAGATVVVQSAPSPSMPPDPSLTTSSPNLRIEPAILEIEEAPASTSADPPAALDPAAKN